MVKRVLSRAFKIGITTGRMSLIAIGLVVVLSVGVLLLPDGAAARVPFLKKGVINNVKAVTTLVGSLADPILRLDNNGTGPALELQVEQGTAPLTVNSAVKVAGLNAELLDGRPPFAFLANAVYKTEAATQAGLQKGDGTYVISHACNAGDVLLSGGPASINSTSTLLESFPTPGITNGWTARINKNNQADDFTVVVLCVDQP